MWDVLAKLSFTHASSKVAKTTSSLSVDFAISEKIFFFNTSLIYVAASTSPQNYRQQVWHDFTMWLSGSCQTTASL